MLRSGVWTVSAVTSLLSTSYAAETKFLSPPNQRVEDNFRDNPQYRIGEAINVTWSITEEAVDLLLEIQFPDEADTPGQSWNYITVQSNHSLRLLDLGLTIS